MNMVALQEANMVMLSLENAIDNLSKDVDADTKEELKRGLSIMKDAMRMVKRDKKKALSKLADRLAEDMKVDLNIDKATCLELIKYVQDEITNYERMARKSSTDPVVAEIIKTYEDDMQIHSFALVAAGDVCYKSGSNYFTKASREFYASAAIAMQMIDKMSTRIANHLSRV